MENLYMTLRKAWDEFTLHNPSAVLNEESFALIYMSGYAEGKRHRVKSETSDSWASNPDRMGGQFTKEEIDDATAWR
jgi:hypothetical protein